MTGAPIPPGDEARVASLRSLDVLDTPPEERFDRVTRLAKRLFDVPIALVSLVDQDRQWFKSRQGLEATQTPRDVAFCAHAILDDGVFVVRDASKDPRFEGTPLVTDDPHICFYAGSTVKAPDGANVGTLCIIDHEPRDMSLEDQQLLQDLAALIEDEFLTLQLATTDYLTGLTNRRGFMAIAVYALATCRRLERPATLVILDLNEFKQVNDVLGHAAGDRALRDFSGHLVDAFRDSDVVARLGGDEFCVLLSGAEEAHADLLVQTLRARLDAAAAATAGSPRIGFSAGSATYDPARHAGPDDLLAEADLRMYKRKRDTR